MRHQNIKKSMPKVKDIKYTSFQVKIFLAFLRHTDTKKEHVTHIYISNRNGLGLVWNLLRTFLRQLQLTRFKKRKLSPSNSFIGIFRNNCSLVQATTPEFKQLYLNPSKCQSSMQLLLTFRNFIQFYREIARMFTPQTSFQALLPSQNNYVPQSKISPQFNFKQRLFIDKYNTNLSLYVYSLNS